MPDALTLAKSSNESNRRTSKLVGHPNVWEQIAIDYFDATSNWDFVFTDGTASPVWTVAANKISSPAAAAQDCFAYYRGVKLSDGRVQVIFENPDSTLTGNKFCGIVLRAGRKYNDYLIILLQSNNPGKIEVWTAGATPGWFSLATANLTPTDVTLTTNVPLALEAEIVGLTLNVYVNGHKMLTYTSDTIANYMYGECGLVADKSRSYTLSNFSIRRKRFDVITPNISKVLCLGTSITYGYGTTNPWPTRFQNLLNQQFSASSVSVINGGVVGDTSAQMLARLPGLLASNTPDVAILEASINDFRFAAPVALDTAIFNLRKMVKLVKQTGGAIPLVSTITTIDPSVNTVFSDMNATTWQRAYQMNARVRQMAGEEGIRVIDNALLFNGDYTLLQDKLHPNDAGYDKIAQSALSTFLM